MSPLRETRPVATADQVPSSRSNFVPSGVPVMANLLRAIDPASIAFVTAPAAMVVANVPVPEPVTFPVNVIVWSPVLIPVSSRSAFKVVSVWTSGAPEPAVLR